MFPLISNNEVAWRKEIFLESLYTGRSNPFCEGLRMSDWKYIRMHKGSGRSLYSEGDIQSYSEEDLEFGGIKPDFEQLFLPER